MDLSNALDLSKTKFGVMLKGLLHGYKPAKNVSFAQGGYNLIVIGASVDGTEAYVKSVLKAPECPENVLCMGADYVFSDKYHVDLHGYIIFLPELIYINDGGIGQILYTLEKIERALTENSDYHLLFGPRTSEYIVTHSYKRWINNDAAFHEFDYNKPPEGLVFDAAKFSEYGALYRKGQNNLHQESYPILFPVIKAKSVIFDIDLEQFSNEHIAHMLLRCQSVNPNLKRWVHKRIAVRLFELHNSNLMPDFVFREHDDRDHQDRDVLEWPLPVEDEDPAQENEPNFVPECKQEPAQKPIGAAWTDRQTPDTFGVEHKVLDELAEKGVPISVRTFDATGERAVDTLTVLEGKGVPTSLLPHQMPPLTDTGVGNGRTVMRLELPADASLEDIDAMHKAFLEGDKIPGKITVCEDDAIAEDNAATPGPMPDCDECLRLDSPKD